jgi:CRP/FNR family transcriptional regulator, cyclic AMP receptor protein
MKEKFETADGPRLLAEALSEQQIVQSDSALATALASKGTLVEFPVGNHLTVHGGDDNDIYFILIGEVEVVVNGRKVADRYKGECIGEMAILTPTALRSATVTATKPTLTLRVTESDFSEIAETFGKVWKVIAKVVATRLRQRERFHIKPNEMPVLFIGSSVEGLPIAHEIVSGLKHDKVIPRPWSTPGVFSPGGVAVDVLIKEVDSSDFAVFVFGPDDKITSRDVDYMAPRDNVIFELGLFIGRSNRDRAFLIKEHTSDVKIPSDLLGITPITYVSKPGQDLATMISPVCAEIRKAVNSLGPR